MQQITLDVLPNQEFSFVDSSVIYRISVYVVDTSTQQMAADISVNGITVIQGTRALHGSFLLPWRSMQQGGGNFVFYAPDTQNPWWQNFGPGCTLWYLSAAEMGVSA